MPDWARGATGSRSVQGCRSRPVPRDGRSSVIVPGGRASAEPLLPRSRLSGGPLAPPSLRPPGPAERVGLGGKSRSGVPPDPLRRDPRGVRKMAKNGHFWPPCGVKSRGSGGAPPTHLILLRNQRIAARRERAAGPGPGAGGWAGFGGWLGCSACGLVLLCDWSSDWNRRKAGASHLSRWSESSPPMAHQWSICSEVPARRVRIDPHLLPARCCIRRVSSVLTMLSHRSASRRADATLCRMRRLAAHQ